LQGLDTVSEERWITDADLATARQRFAAQIPGFRSPAAYGVARIDAGRLTFGFVNKPDSIHRLPAIALATICGYTFRTGVFPLSLEEFSGAVAALQPAVAATHWDHPNLWSWRRLLEFLGGATTDRIIAWAFRSLSLLIVRRAC
jgi:hypothetical protein